MNVNINELLLSISMLLDVAGNRTFQHSKRVTFITMKIIDKIKARDLKQLAFQAAILHDIGVAHSVFIDGYRGFHRAEAINPVLHTIAGYEIVKELPLSGNIADIIKYHHESWDGSGPEGLKGNDIPFISQIIALADAIEFKFDRRRDKYSYRQEFKEWLRNQKGKGFNPRLVDTALDMLEGEKLWLDIGVYDIQHLLNPLIPSQHMAIGIEELEQIARALSLIIDKKSAFTHQHSSHVAERVYYTSKSLGYDDIKTRKMKIAGYLHDLGKLIVPNAILDKPEKLTNEEMLIIKKHPYYSKFILKQITGFDDIAEWGANHHENLLGGGYPEGLSGDAFTEEAQVMAFCDIYQALTEDRIYRRGMTHEAAIDIIIRLVDKGYYKKYIFNIFLEAGF